MPAHGQETVCQPEDVLNAVLYPDLVRLGGLASAMSQAARTEEIDLGEIRAEPGLRGDGRFLSAEVESDRGVISVGLGAASRVFFVSIWNRGGQPRVWTEGATDDLRQVVKAADAWRRGATLRVLAERFPFMRHSAMARAFEDGDPVAAQWDLLLSHELYVRERPMLRAAHSEPGLCALFPAISMGSLMLVRDPRDGTSAWIRIVPLSGGVYRVESAELIEPKREMPSLEEALQFAVARLARPDGGSPVR
ncbi:DUF6193 family natural product biosynthesis protein [Kitasatospora sp. NPDC002965]|uniref:DUF6193 family natural product biosynthesis protein n=1 Tax=Kitasatospora sp. NPDC002965 TaxID=3154775 RepID=UPI0033BEDAAE